MLVLLLAGAGGAGWWFLAGPGAHVTVPDDLAGMTPAAATAELTRLGLQVDPQNGQAFSTTVASGQVADTKPGLGSSVLKNSSVQLLLSQGPRPIAFTITAGMPLDQARAAIKAAPWKLQSPVKKQFSDTIAKGSVIDALDGSGKSLLGTANYGQGQPISLLASAGKLPDVTGKTFDEASTALEAAGVTATQGSQDYSHTVAEGSVIKIETAGPYGPGQSIALTISKGPEPVTVPSVTGETWAQAKQQLLNAGFQLDYSKVADGFPNAFVVSKTNPAGGSTASWGSTVKVNFAGF